MLIRIICGLIFVLEIVATRISAQDLMPLFGDPTRTWSSEYTGAVYQDCGETEIISHWINGDTLIDNNSYLRIRSNVFWDQFYIMGGPGDCEAWDFYPGLTAFVREDSNKVYRWNDGVDHLIYDFNAQVGDTVPSCGHFNGPPEMYCWYRIVEYVDSILINGTYRKRMRLLVDLPNDTLAIIEGIGSTSGLFSLLDHQIGLSHFQRLVCVRENGEIIHGEGSCMLVTNVSEPPSNSISLHPNPTTGIIHFSDQVNYEIFDATGRAITSGRSTTADITAQTPGIYLIRLSDDKIRSHHRVVLEY